MNKELKFLWVDDEPQRKRAADSLKDELGVDMTFICVEGENIDTKLNEILSTSSQPDLIIMDHILLFYYKFHNKNEYILNLKLHLY